MEIKYQKKMQFALVTVGKKYYLQTLLEGFKYEIKKVK